MTTRSLVPILVVIFLTAHISAARDQTTPPGKEFIYKQSQGKPQVLEVYFPKDHDAAKARVPGVILFHGGGWGGGSLDQFRHACRYLASRGLVAATANYRMLPKKERDTLRAGESYKRVCITDAKSAIRWMKQHAAELGIDPRRIITGGGSAGGHISILATTNPGLDDPADPKDFDTSVVAYLLFNPALGKDTVQDTAVDALPHLTASFAPAIVFFGATDTWMPGWTAAYARLKSLGVTKRIHLWLAAGQAHGFFNTAPWTDITLIEADRFLVSLGLLQGEPTLKPAADAPILLEAK